MNPSDYSLLTEFRKLFEGRPYLHRNSSQGDKAVRYLYEDLRKLNKSSTLRTRGLESRVAAETEPSVSWFLSPSP